MAAAAAKAAGAPATLWEVSEDGSVELNDVLELQEYAGAGLEDGCTVVRAQVTSEFPLMHSLLASLCLCFFFSQMHSLRLTVNFFGEVLHGGKH